MKEVVVLLLGQLPLPKRERICAHLATIPGLWSKLSLDMQAQAKSILKREQSSIVGARTSPQRQR